ncbi:MAG TPA: FAD-dependent oxidoreductase [Anaerolineae bacterium]|nr:FAD-dependent oxidoreductase [Anaerolineae bacterium]
MTDADGEKVEVVVVGAGLAGLSTAYVLAQAGVDTVVVERGDYPGAKNVTGGRIYMHPLRHYLPGLWDEAPLERHVTRETLTMIAEGASTAITLDSDRFREEPHHSYTILRSNFDRWLGDKVAEAGAFVLPKYRADDVLMEDGRAVGIVMGEEDEIRADVVVAADGVLSLVAEKAGLRQAQQAKHFAVSAKEVIELPAKSIEERFNLGPGEGAAQLYFGALTKGMLGGGFLYTNKESISLGLVVGIESLMEREPKIEVHDILEDFKARPEIRNLIADGETVEYSAHVIPEGGINAMPKLYSDGIVVVGEAAGLGLNMLLTVRGMEFAVVSGVMAAEAIKKAREKGDYSAASLAQYQESLSDTFVLKDLQTFRSVLDVMENPRLFNFYPQAVCDIFTKLMWIDENPKPKISSTVIREVLGKFLNWSTVKDGLRMLRI